MENENITGSGESPFEFLENSDAQEHFADLNIGLLRGRHIQNDNYYLFQLLVDYTQELENYYKQIYGLKLVEDIKDESRYFYLDFFEEGKGKVSNSQRHKVLTEMQTILGIMLLNMYYDRYFETPKEIRLNDIKKEVLDGENRTSYKRLLFNEVRENYTSTEWKRVITSIKTTLRDFEQLGWVERLPLEEGEEVHFLIKETIHRFQKLYQKEILGFEQFVESYLFQKKA